MTDDELAAIEARVQAIMAATGPIAWDVYRDAQLAMTHAPTDLAALVAEVRRLQERVSWLNKQTARYSELFGQLPAGGVILDALPPPATCRCCHKPLSPASAVATNRDRYGVIDAFCSDGCRARWHATPTK